MLFLKRLSDEFEQKRSQIKREYRHLAADQVVELLEDPISYADTFFIPRRARWYEGYTDENGDKQPPLKDLKANVGTALDKALAAIEEANTTLEGLLRDTIDFDKTISGKQKVSNQQLVDLLHHFNEQLALINDNFEFPDLLGAAYEYLIKYFADSAGKKGGEFYTPPTVTQLMVRLVQPQAGMSIYDPTVGSGGMLLQSVQHVEENGQDASNLSLFGQELNGTVWAVCRMNLILHNRADAHVANGDTLTEPLHLEADGSLRRFDRVLANPPFSQKYTRANLKLANRFRYGFAPETGKKADLMFVQHMVASLSPRGVMATVMPHGVLFRGAQERVIREGIVRDGILEAVIGLPPALFYGTGIPACILVINRDKPADRRDEVLFINADAEFAEGKVQNNLRPEDIEKIGFVFAHHLEIPRYSRRVPLAEIERNEFNLNIRRYVDNTPPPEPEDVRGHLLGGLPAAEVTALDPWLGKLALDREAYFVPLPDAERAGRGYFALRGFDRTDLRPRLETDPALVRTLAWHGQALADWWQTARTEFALLAEGRDNLPHVRADLLTTLKTTFGPSPTLDEFQVAGIFANWWEGIRFDLKTIVTLGWVPSLVPNDLLSATFFGAEQAELADLEREVAEAETAVQEALDAVETDEEADGEEETSRSVADVKKALKEQLAETNDAGAKAQLAALLAAEERLKAGKKALKAAQELLTRKLDWKRYGIDEEDLDLHTRLLYNQKLLLDFDADHRQKAGNVLTTGPASYADKKRQSAYAKDRKALEKVIAELQTELDALRRHFAEMGGLITPDECRELILRHHHERVSAELNRYLLATRRQVLARLDNLVGKYETALHDLDTQRSQTQRKLTGFLTELNFLN